MQQLSFLTETMLFVLKQYEEEVNYKMLTEEEQEEGKYFKLNEKVLLRTDSKTQMDIFAAGINNGVYKPNEARRKLDMPDEEGGDQLIVNGNYIPLVQVGEQYRKEQEAEKEKEAGQQGAGQMPEPKEGQQAGREEGDGQNPPDNPPEPQEEPPEPSGNGEEGGQPESDESQGQETAETDAPDEEKEGGEEGDEDDEDELQEKKRKGKKD